MSENPSELMACFVELSSHKERATLECSLVKTLCQLLDREVSLIQLYNGRNEFEPTMNLRASKDGSIHTDSQILVSKHCELFDDINSYLAELKHNTPSAIYQQQGRGFWPLKSADTCISLLSLNCEIKSDYEVKLLDAFGRIFTNFLALLDAGERDALTGLYNRRVFDTQLSNLVRKTIQSFHEKKDRRRSAQEPTNFLGIIDIDYFKRVNDDFGHLFGDEVLLWLAQKMRQCFRNEDALFRYGGEEFAVLLTGLSQQQALETFERFRLAIETTKFPQVGHITVSIGFSHIDKQANPTLVFGDADKALYYAKEHGRNQVHCYQTLIENDMIETEETDNLDIELF